MQPNLTVSILPSVCIVCVHILGTKQINIKYHHLYFSNSFDLFTHIFVLLMYGCSTLLPTKAVGHQSGRTKGVEVENRVQMVIEYSGMTSRDLSREMGLLYCFRDRVYKDFFRVTVEGANWSQQQVDRKG